MVGGAACLSSVPAPTAGKRTAFPQNIWPALAGAEIANCPCRALLNHWQPDLFDCNTRQLIWRGWATDALPDDPKKETKKLNKEIAKLFKNFPPE